MRTDPTSREIWRGTDVRNTRMWHGNLSAQVHQLRQELARVRAKVRAPQRTPSPASAPGALPPGENENDSLWWDATEEKWVVMDAPSTTGTWVPMVVDGVRQWVEASTMVCTT